MTIFLQPILVRTSDGVDDGRLAFVDGTLVAVLVQLSGKHYADLNGRWFLEAGFGPCNDQKQSTFDSLSDAETWIAARLMRSA